MIVRTGTAIAPNVGRLRGMTLPTVEGPLRLGYVRRGMGLTPGTIASCAAIARAARRRRGMGAVIQYCQNNPPDATTQAIITGRGDSISLVPCGGAVPTNQPAPTTLVAPTYQPPTGIQDCVTLGLATSAGQACVARNTQLAVDAENAHLTANQDYQTALCISNGGGGYVPAGADLGSWCANQYGGAIPSTYVPGTPAQPESGLPVGTNPTPAAPSSSTSPAPAAPSAPAASAPAATQSSPASASRILSDVTGGFDFSSVPTWAWLAAAGVGAFLIFGGKH